MTFIFPALLAGLLLASLPVVLHLILRQQPKRIRFPAFQFLARKATSNRRRLQLRHLLLLLMRIFLIGLMCLALARPRIFSERLNLVGDRPVAAVIVIDTSSSMGYTVAGRSRLDDAKNRALELLETLPLGSKLAVLDTGEPGGDWLPNATAARERIASREFKSSAVALADPITAAYRLFAELTRQAGEGEDPLARFIYIFTDRTPACWDASRTRDVITARDKLGEPQPIHVLVDVGLDKPSDVAITEVRLRPQVVSANKPLTIPVTVQSVGQAIDTQIQCRIDGVSEVETKPIQVGAGQAKEVVFRRPALKPGFYQAEISLATNDALPADNVQYITFEVRVPRPVLIVCDRVEDSQALALALKANYPSEVRTTSDPALRQMSPADLAKYRAICWMSVAEPGAAGLWDKLEQYVQQGGGLAIFPGGEELIALDYNREGPARRLLPGSLKQILPGGNDGAVWVDYQYSHPLMAPFAEYARMPETGFSEQPPRAFRFWEVEALPKSQVLVRYSGDPRRPAILETTFDRSQVRGKLLLFTTPCDDRRDARDQPWNDYLQSWFYLALTNKTLQYLAGEAEDAEMNFVAGPPVPIALPPGIRPSAFNLIGPGLAASDTLVPRPDKASELRLTQPQQPGNYKLLTPDRSWSTAFSVNAPASEFQLVPRVPTETIAEVFGPDAIVEPGQTADLRDKLDQHFRQPLELFPWLMLLVLLLFAVECYFANRFYRDDDQNAGEPRAALQDQS